MNSGIDQATANRRAATLTAILMYDLDIALENVVPHYHWSGKNCPRLLLNDKKPGAKWKAFIKQVNDIFANIEPGSDAIANLFSDSDPHLAEWFEHHGIES